MLTVWQVNVVLFYPELQITCTVNPLTDSGVANHSPFEAKEIAFGPLDKLLADLITQKMGKMVFL